MDEKRVSCQQRYPISAAALWAFLRDFYADWHPAMAWCKREENDVRCFAGADDGTVYREQLLEHHDDERRYRYVALEGIAGIESYEGTLHVVADGDGCLVVQKAVIHAPQPRLDNVVSGTEFIFNIGLEALGPIVKTQLTVQTQRIDGQPQLAIDAVGKGELVLFLHGIGGGRSNWRGQLAALAPHCQAVALDFRGYGDSELGNEAVTVANQMGDIKRIMAHFSAQKVHLVGLSYGGWLAACFAHLHPDRVASLTCCAGSTGMSEADAAEIGRFRQLRLVPMEAGQPPAAIAAGVVDFISGPDSTADIRAEMVASMAAIPRQTYIAALRCFLSPPFKIGFEQFNFPTHFIAGEHDKLASPAEMKGVARRVPNGRFSIVAGAGHLINLERPAAFNRLLRRFLMEQLQ